MKTLVVAALAGAGIIAASVAISAEDPILVRQALMKNTGAAMGTLAKMAKGEMEFDAAAAALSVRIMQSTAYGVGFYFPKGSETGNKTTVSPAVWEKRGDFDAALASFQATTSAAVANPPKTKEELGATVGALGKNCGTCHKAFRVKKDG